MFFFPFLEKIYEKKKCAQKSSKFHLFWAEIFYMYAEKKHTVLIIFNKKF